MSKDQERRAPRVCRSMYMQMEEIDRERAESGWNPYVGEEEPVAQELQVRSLAYEVEAEAKPLSQHIGSEAPTHAAAGATSATMSEQMPQNMPLVYDDTDWGGAAEGQNLSQNNDQKDARAEMTRPEKESPDSESRPAWLPQETLNTGTEQASPNAVPRFQMPDREMTMQQEQEFERDLQRLQTLYPDSAVLLLPYVEEECEKMEYDTSQMYLLYPDREMLNQIVARIYGAVREQFPPMEEQKRDEMLAMQSCKNCQKPGENWAEDMIRLMLLQEMHRRRCRRARCGRGFL